MVNNPVNIFPHYKLRDFCYEVLLKLEVPTTDANLVTDTLINASLRGIDSHGVVRMGIYAKRLACKIINPQPEVNIVKKTPAFIILDGDNGLGQVVSSAAMNIAINKAKKSGIAFVGVRNSNHFGAASYYSMMALKHDMIGFATSNAKAVMTPWGSRISYFGTNPLSFTVPTNKELPIVLDMATSITARGKITDAARKNKPIPYGWAIDVTGEITTDANKALEGAVLPFGGAKGSAIALLLEIFCGILNGAAFGPYIGDLFNDMKNKQNLGHLIGAIEIRHFIEVEEFKSKIDQMIQDIKKLPVAKGHKEVLLPGEIEFICQQRREKEGIPLTSDVIMVLKDLSSKYNVPWLE